MTDSFTPRKFIITSIRIRNATKMSLYFMISYRQKAEYGIATGNNRNCNCQHIIDDQSAA